MKKRIISPLIALILVFICPGVAACEFKTPDYDIVIGSENCPGGPIPLGISLPHYIGAEQVDEYAYFFNGDLSVSLYETRGSVFSDNSINSIGPKLADLSINIHTDAVKVRDGRKYYLAEGVSDLTDNGDGTSFTGSYTYVVITAVDRKAMIAFVSDDKTRAFNAARSFQVKSLSPFEGF